MPPEVLLLSLIIAAIGFSVCAWVAAEKNRNAVTWGIAGAIIAVPAMILVVLLQPWDDDHAA